MLIQTNGVISEFVNFHAFFRDRKVTIPLFQRYYDWRPAQVEEILNDITEILNGEKYNSIFYLLDFIYYEEDGETVIADGQQRLVSMNLFRLAIGDFLRETGSAAPSTKLYEITYTIPGYEKKYKEAVQNYPRAPFKAVYLRFFEYIKEHSNHVLDILKILEDDIYIFAKKCLRGNDAFAVFQQINTGGKPLSKDEIIKTSIEQWSDLYRIPLRLNSTDLTKKIVSYQKFIDPKGRASNDTVTLMNFLRKHVVKDKGSFQTFVDACETLNEISSHPILSVINYINRKALLEIVYVLAMQGINIYQSGEYIEKVIAPLCLLSVCMTLKKANPGGIVQSLYGDMIAAIKEGKGANDLEWMLANFIDLNPSICKMGKTEFSNALNSPDTRLQLKKGLLVLDVILANVSSTIDLAKIDVEHIYPKKPCSDWAGKGGWPTSSQDQKVYINNMGNLFLLNGKVNRKIQNSYIADKIPEYLKIIEKDAGLYTHANTVDFQAFELDGPLYLQKRTEKIVEILREDVRNGKKMILS